MILGGLNIFYDPVELVYILIIFKQNIGIRVLCSNTEPLPGLNIPGKLLIEVIILYEFDYQRLRELRKPVADTYGTN